MPVRVTVALALALAAVGFGLIVAGAWALGYGHDLHAIRVAGALGVLIAAMLRALWPGRSPSRRLLAAASGLLLASVAWWLIPAGHAGRSLLSAGTERELISVWLRKVLPGEVSALPQLRERVEALAADYPSLSAGLGRKVDDKIEKAIDVRIAELGELSATDPAGFTRTAPARRAIVVAFPDALTRLVAAEEKWATRWANYTAVAYTHADMSPKHVREGCRASETQLREMPTLDDAPTRLLEARRVFFQAAHESALDEIRALRESERFERAFGVALAHGFEWSQVPGLLGPDEQKGVADLREQCRALLQPGGDPEAIPPPRAIETAPLPRPK